MTYGRLKAKIIKVPSDIRPISSKVRSALMNSWQYQLPGAQVLDIFAGSGSVGLEAVARGAAQVLFVEGSAPVIAVLKENCALLEPAETRVVRAQLPLSLEILTRLLPTNKGSSGKFDLIFVDPPYLFSEYQELLDDLMALLAKDGELAIEHSSKRGLPPKVVGDRRYSVRTRLYGDSQLTLMAWANSPEFRPGHPEGEDSSYGS